MVKGREQADMEIDRLAWQTTGAQRRGHGKLFHGWQRAVARARTYVLLLLAVLTTVTFSSSTAQASAGASNQPVTGNVSAVALAYANAYPPGATPPVRKYWHTLFVNKTGESFSRACVNLRSNITGHYWLNTNYWGWSYVDARGVSFVGWYKDGRAGPYDLVGSRSYPVCGP